MAINYDEWPTLSLSVDTLKLDPKNPRLAEEKRGGNQTQLIHALAAEFKVHKIAKSIAQKGYFVNSNLIAVKERGKYVVLEGNRRLTALKLLKTPQLSPPRSRRFHNLAATYPNAVREKITCHIAPSREAARPYIYAIHAGENSVEKWERLSKHQFIADDLLKGIPIEELAINYDTTEADIRTAAFEILLRQLVLDSELEEDLKQQIRSFEFNLSTVPRYLMRKHFMDTTKMRIEGHTLTFDYDFKQFEFVVTRVFVGIHSGELGTRNLKGKAIDEKLDEFFKEAKDLFKDNGEESTGGSSYSPGGISPLPAPPDPPAPPTSSGGNSGPREMLISKDFPINTGSRKLDSMLKEGTKIMLGYYKNASGLLLRAILEQATYRIFELNGAVEELYVDFNDKNSWKSGQIRPLGYLLRSMASKPKWFRNQKYRKKLARFADQESTAFIHIETLNGYTHDQHHIPDAHELRNFWTTIMPLIKMVQAAYEAEEESPAA